MVAKVAQIRALGQLGLGFCVATVEVNVEAEDDDLFIARGGWESPWRTR